MNTRITIIGIVIIGILLLPSHVFGQSQLPPSIENDEPSTNDVVQPSQNFIATPDGIYAHSSSRLYLLDPSTGAASLIGSFGFSDVTDIAFLGNELYGITFNRLIKINPTTGAATSIGFVGYTVNSLTSTSDGKLLAGSGNNLIQINKTTGVGTPIGKLGVGGLESSGDLAFVNGDLFVSLKANFGDKLAKVNPTTGAATVIGNIGYSDIYGLAPLGGQLIGVAAGGQVLRINIGNGVASLLSKQAVTFWGMSTTRDEYAALTNPKNEESFGAGNIQLDAIAYSASVKEIRFYAFYDGKWQSAGTDNAAPFSTIWQSPANLKSQRLRFKIDAALTDNTVQNTSGGERYINYLESVSNPAIQENWVPTRYYLNQRSLPNGDVKCSATSLAMILAMNGVISFNYETMAASANSMYPRLLDSNGNAVIWKYVDELKRQGMSSTWNDNLKRELDAQEGWNIVKREIDAGHPVVVRGKSGVLSKDGHILVAVGYRQDAQTQQIIAYDPYGKWLGTTCGEAGCPNNYDRNTLSSASYKGQWVFYDFEKIFASYLVTATRRNGETTHLVANGTPSTTPDDTSDEPANIGTYTGVVTLGLKKVYLPVVER